MSGGLLAPLLLSLQVATLATLAVLPPGILLGHLLARRRFPGRSVVETLTFLPLVLPPTAAGYLLLLLLGRGGPLGADTLGFDPGLLFTRAGAALAAATMALPLVARSARAAFEQVDPRLEAMARTLGHGRVGTWLRFTLPLARHGLLAAAVLGFGRALGEFGATILVAGNIPGRTQTLPLAIFSEIQTGNDRAALALVGVTVALAFAAIWTVEALQRRARDRSAA